jgi:pyochelin synthetase
MPYVFTGAIGLIPTERTALTGRMTQGGISQTAQVFMDCQAMDSAAGLNINIDTRDGVFKEGVVKNICEALHGLLHSLAEDSRYWTDTSWKLPLPAYQQETRDRVNATAAVQDRYLLHERVLRSIRKHPEALAVADAHCAWNGEALYQAVCRTAAALQKQGLTAGDRVVIALPKSRWQLAACLAVLVLGGVYVPVDISYGEGRLGKILNKVRPRCVICHSQYPAAIPADYTIQYIDTLTEETELPEDRPVDDTAPAYIIFTSGSTGEPKGVEISHRAAVNTIEAVNRRYGICSSDRVFNISQLNFDLSVYDLFGVIACGGAVVIPDHEQYKNPAHWAEMMERYKVTVWNSVPALMQMYLIYRQYQESTAEVPLRLALLSGDWIPTDLPAEIGQAFEGIRVVSLGGATEGGIWSIWHDYVPEDQNRPSIPYGIPMPNQGFMIKDAMMQDCPDWVQGELYITGDGLAEGYYGEEDLTRNAFLTLDGVRMYKTGDAGCYHPDGMIEFMGRNDHQVKLRGHRIELGEIESVMKKTFSLDSVSCLLHGVQGDQKLAAIYAAETEIPETEAAQKLSSWLPDYMIPAVFIRTDQMPLTANGKIDQKALYALTDQHLQRSSAEQMDVPMTETEQKVSRILTDILGVSALSPDADLYEEGANSLILARAAGKLREAVDPEISFDDYLVHLLNTPNVRAVAAFVDNAGAAAPQETERSGQNGIRDCIGDREDIHIVFEDGLSGGITALLEHSDAGIVYLSSGADTAGLLKLTEGHRVVSLAGSDHRLGDILTLACDLAAAGIVPDSVNILESETESQAELEVMYAGDLCYGLTVSPIGDAEEIRSIMEDFCMGEICVTECRDAETAAQMLLGRTVHLKELEE